MEVLQVLKFLYKQERLDFTSDWVAHENNLLWTPDATTDEARRLVSDLDENSNQIIDILNSSVPVGVI